MDQDIAAVAVVDYALRRARVARDHNSSIRSFEPVTERLRYLAVVAQKRLPVQVAVLVHEARADLVDVDLVSAVIVLGEIPLHAFCADSDVLFPRFEDVVRHRLDADWPVDLNGTGPANDPGRENEVGIPDSVIRMQMGYKARLELRELKSLHSLLVGARGSPHNPPPHLNELSALLDHHSNTG